MLFLRFTDHLWVSNDVSSPSIRYRAADGDHSDPGSVAPESGWRPTTRCSPHFLTLEPRTPGTCCAMLCHGRIQSVSRNQLHSKSFNCHPRVDHSKSLKGSFWKKVMSNISDPPPTCRSRLIRVMGSSSNGPIIACASEFYPLMIQLWLWDIDAP